MPAYINTNLVTLTAQAERDIMARDSDHGRHCTPGGVFRVTEVLEEAPYGGIDGFLLECVGCGTESLAYANEPDLAPADLRPVTLEEERINTEGRAYLESFVGTRVLYTRTDRQEQVQGTLELDTREAAQGRPYGKYLLIRFVNGSFARSDNDFLTLAPATA